MMLMWILWIFLNIVEISRMIDVTHRPDQAMQAANELLLSQTFCHCFLTKRGFGAKTLKKNSFFCKKGTILYHTLQIKSELD